MTHVRRFDHVGLTVSDLASATAFFVALGLEVEGTGSVQGDGHRARAADLDVVVEELAADGYGLVGGVGEYQGSVRMAYVRGPDGIVVSLFEQIGRSAAGES